MTQTRHLKQIVRAQILEALGVVSRRTSRKTLRVFDFDDTLVKTNSQVGVTEYDVDSGKKLGQTYWISPGRYSTFRTDTVPHHPEIRYEFDYRQFAEVRDPKIIDFTFRILQAVVSKLREDTHGTPAVILTARGHDARESIKRFLQDQGIEIPVVTLNDSLPAAKAEWIKKAMLTGGIPHVEFFDDSPLNVKAVSVLNGDKELREMFRGDLLVRSRLVSAEK